MSFGDAVQRRADLLRKRGADVDKILREISEGATIQAVRAATEKTPPTGGGPSGTNTRSGELKAHWATDSETKPEVSGGTYTTYLKNNMRYAAYVDQGHRMDKHFVPGLILNPVTGQLERSPDGSGGIVVGTKTQYVPGIFMSEAGHEAFEDSVLRELTKLLREVFKP